jgi:NADPH:quinone reductase-like Zn-dependent oxidoreductase
MKFKRVIVTKTGGPEVLQVIEDDLREPSPGEARIKILAAAVSRPDITARSGKALYHGTPLGQKIPFTPGYAVIGTVDAIGEGVRQVVVGDRVGALTVIHGYSEYLYWKSDKLIPVPEDVDPGEAVPLILNYIVAYQALHRSLKVKAGETALIIGASGGIGTALLQLGRLAGLRLYGLASSSKHAALAEYGATLINYRTQDFVDVIHQSEPGGIDVVLDGMMDVNDIRRALSLLRRGGRLVSFGEPAGGFPNLFRVLGIFAAVNLLPNGKSYQLYGTSTYFIGDPKPYYEDWATLFKLYQEGKIKPVIEQRFTILEAAQANALLESGAVVGNVVLVAPE